MEYVAIIVSFLALIAAGFAFLRANSSHNILSKRIEILKEKNSSLMARLVKLEGNPGKGSKQGNDFDDTERERTDREKGKKHLSRREQQEEQRQKPPRHEVQDEPRQKQPRQEQQESKQPRPDKQEKKHKNKDKQRQAQPMAPAAEQVTEEVVEQPQQKRRKENRRRHEQLEKGNYGELERTQQLTDPAPIMVIETQDRGEEQVEKPEPRRRNQRTEQTPEPASEMEPAIIPSEVGTVPASAPLTPAEPETTEEPVVFEPLPVDESTPERALEPIVAQEPVSAPEPDTVSVPEPVPAPAERPEEKPYGGRRFAIVPEDGVIRRYQLQQRPHTGSFIEVDPPAEGSNNTHYRFTFEGENDIAAEDIARLENAFDFEAPADPGVSKVMQQQDGLLVKVNNGWRIMEKARIDFR